MFKKLNNTHKTIIDLVVSGASYVEASIRAVPSHETWTSKQNSSYVSRIIQSELGQKYYQERLREAEKAKNDALKDRYKKPLWSFDDSVQHLRLVVQMAKEELASNRERFRMTRKGSILTPTCVNALLNSISMLNKLYRYDQPDTPMSDDSKHSLEKELLILRAEKEKLQLEKEIITLDREKGEICYNDVAVSEFSKVIKSVHDAIVRLPQALTSENSFTIEQKSTIITSVEKILDQLSNITVDLSSAQEIDKKLSEMSSHSSKASKKKQVQK